VEPSHFFGGASAPQDGVIPAAVPGAIGKELRSERRKRHISAEDLAAKLGLQKHQIISIEEAKRPLLPELTAKICKILKLPANHFLSFQQRTIEALEAQITRLNQALAEDHRGRQWIDGDGDVDVDSTASPRRGVPVLGTLAGGYPQVFDSLGRPAGEPDEFLYLTSAVAPSAFAVQVIGDTMEQPARPSFAEGDLVVFADGALRSRDFAFVHRRGSSEESAGSVTFRQIFFEAQSRVRLQPLNLNHSAEFFHRDELLGMWRLTAHVASF
jgi:transcriptional regulator with XRE-family HTH domain